MKNVVIYDNGTESFDRFTVFTPDGNVYGMSESGTGFNQWVGTDKEIKKGPHLGKRLKAVPASIEKAVNERMKQ